MTQRERISQILSSLERTNENLLDLSDDIWLGIDHNDPDELEAGVAFKQEYNAAMTEFAQAAERIQQLITDYTSVAADDEATDPDVNADEHDRIIKELDRSQRHTLDEDFRYKRPYGFVFEERAAKDLRTWRAVYERVIRLLARLEGDAFGRIATDEDFATNRGNRMFASSGEGMRKSREVVPGLWAELNLSANNIRDRIVHLLEHFDYDPSSFVVYLHEDRDAEEE
jgi:hypothetical protein